MRLRILIPTEVVVDEAVSKVTAEAEHGCFCLLPRHTDFLAALVPGLLSFVDGAGAEQFVAVDKGTLVKRDEEVFVSTNQAVLGGALAELRTIVSDEFSQLDDRERAAQAAVAKLEASFLREYLEFVEGKR